MVKAYVKVRFTHLSQLAEACCYCPRLMTTSVPAQCLKYWPLYLLAWNRSATFVFIDFVVSYNDIRLNIMWWSH